MVDEKALDAWLASNNDSEGSFFVMGVISGTGELKFAIVEDDDSIEAEHEIAQLKAALEASERRPSQHLVQRGGSGA